MTQITIDRSALEQALDALDELCTVCEGTVLTTKTGTYRAALTAGREALAAVDAKLAKAGAQTDAPIFATHPQASEPAPSTAGAQETAFSQENYDVTFPSSAGRKRLQEFDLRGLLAAKLTCWHRLTEKESDELVALLQSTAQPESDPNAPWLTKAHMLCTDNGVPQGNIEWRMEALRGLLSAPAALPVVELTDEQIDAAIEAWFGAEVEAKGFKTRMRLAIEAAHKIGGHG